MEAEPPLGHHEQPDRFEHQRDRGCDRGAGGAEQRNEDDAQREVDRECAGVNEGADPLLAQHVEQPLDRADRGARQEAERQDEHQVVAAGELGAEQAQDRPAECEQQRGRGERRPERPLDGLLQEVGEPGLVAGDVVAAEPVRGGGGDRVVR